MLFSLKSTVPWPSNFCHFPERANIPGGAFRQFRGLLKTQRAIQVGRPQVFVLFFKKHGTLAVKFFRPILTAPRSQDRGGWGDRILEQICEILEIRCKIPRQGAPFSGTSPIFKICSFEPIEKYAKTTKPWYPLPAIAYQDAS